LLGVTALEALGLEVDVVTGKLKAYGTFIALAKVMKMREKL